MVFPGTKCRNKIGGGSKGGDKCSIYNIQLRRGKINLEGYYFPSTLAFFPSKLESLGERKYFWLR